MRSRSSSEEKQSGPRALDPTFGMALDLVGLNRPEEAIPLFRQVMAVRANVAPVDGLASVEFELAKLTHDKKLAKQARDRISGNSAHVDDIREIDEFLAK